MASAVTPQAAAPGDLPPPLVRLRRHPLRWVRIRAVLLVDAVVLAHLGALVVAAVYYLCTQTDPAVKHWWDSTVQPPSLRHDIRDVGEGVLASCFAQGVVWNHFARGHASAGARFAELRARRHVPVTLTAIATAVVVGAAAFAVGEAVIALTKPHVRQVVPHGAVWTRAATLWTSGYDKKALGFVAAVVARRPLHVVFDRVQLWFARERAARSLALRWYHPPVFKARVNALAGGDATVDPHPVALRVLGGAALAVGAGLAAFGFYVLTYVA
ncbi:MAG TPA: hypothetical protein VFP61_13030 [Acidimicrobiales bacterium]|nr:hypothetical protein [Acidimicrobiales bacterium]